MGNTIAYRELRDILGRNGLSLMGVVSDVSLREERAALETWQEQGYAADMTYMKRDPALLTDPKKVFADAKTIVSCAVRYSQKPHPVRPQGYGRVARYAWGKDYHTVLKERLHRVSIELEKQSLQTRIFTDAVPLLERPFAAKSGLGFIGKNSLLIIPKIGSLVLLGEILLDCEVTGAPLLQVNTDCGSCSQCRSACPTQAIVADHVVDARRCISYLTIEKKGPFADHERTMLGEWLFGCDVCQDVCPFNHTPLKIGVSPDIEEFDDTYGSGPLVNLEELICIRSDDEFRQKFANTPLLRPKRHGLIRNALCVAVNTHATELVPAMKRCLSDSSDVVQTTARWALDRIGI